MTETGPQRPWQQVHDLPTGVIERIMSRLPLQDAARLSGASRALHTRTRGMLRAMVDTLYGELLSFAHACGGHPVQLLVLCEDGDSPGRQRKMLLRTHTSDASASITFVVPEGGGDRSVSAVSTQVRRGVEHVRSAQALHRGLRGLLAHRAACRVEVRGWPPDHKASAEASVRLAAILRYLGADEDAL